MDWLRAEGPSESTLANSVETLLPDIIARCLHFVGDVVSVRAGLLSKERVETIISSVRLEMDEIKKENGVWREAEIVTKAGELRLSPRPQISTWESGLHAVPVQTTPSKCSQSEICSTAVTAKSEGAWPNLTSSLPRERNTAGEST